VLVSSVFSELQARLKYNRDLLRQGGMFNKSKAELRKEMLAVAEKRKIKFRDATKAELAAVREKVIADREEKRLKLVLVYGLVIMVFAGMLFPAVQFFTSPLPPDKNAAVPVVKKETPQEKRAKHDFFIRDAESWMQKGHYKNALFQYKKALGIFTESIEAHQGMAAAYTYQCQLENLHCPEAKEKIEWLIAQHPNHPHYYELRSIYHQSMGDSVEAHLDSARAQVLIQKQNG